jgi:hypothetical protein
VLTGRRLKADFEYALAGRRFEFDASRSGTVRITNKANNHNVADAVKFLKVED